MADKKISDLTAGTPAQATDQIPISRAGANFKLALSDLSAVVGGSSPLTTKGDLFGHSTVDARIPIGSDGQVLTADSAQALGLKWAAAATADVLNTVASSGASQTVNYATADVWDITLTGNCTITLSGFTNAKPDYLSLILRQDGTGSRTVTWPTITWIGTGTAPTLQTAAGSVDSVVLFSFDGGTTVFGVAQTSASGLRTGTSFPGSPSDADLFYRTDRRIMYEYNSSVTRWLSLDRKYVSFTGQRALNGGNPVSGILGFMALFEDVYVESWVTLIRTGGTNNGSNFTTVTMKGQSSAQVDTTLSTVSTSADATGTNAVHNVSINALYASATYPAIYINVTNTGAPTNSDVVSELILRSAG